MINYGNIMTESCGKRPHSHLADSSPKEIEISKAQLYILS